LALARLLARRRGQVLTVATNSLAVASVLGGASGITLHLLGGIFLNRQATLFGERAVSALLDWEFDAAFLGGEAMNGEGIWNSHPDVVQLQRAALTQTSEIYFCLDATKLGRATPHRVATWGEAGHLVSDASQTALLEAGIVLTQTQLIAA
jgi:DeoR/GlpR family transcriptional regulator of sugar metabolism